MSKSKKTTAVRTVPQKHGGALAVGGTPGNKGGLGRPPSALRNLFRKDLETARLKMLEILDRETDECEVCGGTKRAMDKDIIAIFDKIAKYGIGERKENVSVDTDFMNELGAVVGRYVHDTETLEAIREEWLAILADRLGS